MLTPAFTSNKLRLVRACVFVCVCVCVCVCVLCVCVCVCVHNAQRCSKCIDQINFFLIITLCCLQMVPLFHESIDRMMGKLAEQADKGQSTDAIE